MEGLQLNIWSVLIIIGAIQGFILAFGFMGKSKPPANRYLAFFLLAISIHLVEYAIDISGLVIKVPHLFTASYPFLFMMGPFFYFYTKAVFNQDFRFRYMDLIHFIPSFLVLLLFSPFYLQSAAEKIAFMQNLGAEEILAIPTSQFVFMFSHVMQMLIYTVLAHQILKKKEEQLKQVSASTAIKQFSWTKKFTLGFVTYLGLYLLSLLIILLSKFYRVEIDYIILLLTSIGVYAIGYTAVRQPLLFQQIQLTNGRATKHLNNIEQSRIKNQLENYFESEKPYLNEHLKLDDVAEALSVPAYQLSEVINESFHKNFFEFTNHYRIEEAKAILVNPKLAELKILAVAFDSGFGNKATFNRVFKNTTGQTPSQYKLSNSGS